MSNLIFSLDPGSKKTGWCVMNDRCQLLQAGLIRPDKQSALSEFRIHRICEDLWQLLGEWKPGIILLEWSSGKAQRRHKGRGAGLAVHGAATGALWRECVAWRRSQPAEQQLEIKIVLIRENNWTNGIPKHDRAVAIADMFPQYKIEKDVGLDIADAIGLNVWYQREQAVRLVECLK